MKRQVPGIFLFLLGGTGYICIEFFWRGFSHWSMFIAGGLCFHMINRMNMAWRHSVPMLRRCAVGAVIITSIEFFIGCIVNIWFGWGVWDYSNVPFNLMGQISLPFTLCWFALSAPIIWIGELLNFRWIALQRGQRKEYLKGASDQ